MLLAPARLPIRSPVDVKILKVSCGNYHTLLMSNEGEVFSLGSNCHGQLGVGDTKRRMGPHQVSLPPGTKIKRLSAGANHSVLMTQEGQVFTFGSNRQGQLGREGVGKNWQTSPGLIPGINSQAGLVAIWVRASGDMTLVQCRQHLLQSSGLEMSCITGDHNNIIIFPLPDHQGMDQNYLVIDRKGKRFQHAGTEFGKSLLNTKWALDPSYNVLWAYDLELRTISAYSNWFLGDASEGRQRKGFGEFIRSPEYWIPTTNSDTLIPETQMGLSVLSTIYALTLRQEELQRSEMTGSCANIDLSLRKGESVYGIVDRFQNYGGGWGYSAQSVEAVQFQPSQDIYVLGLGLYGGRGEYVARLKLLRLVAQDYDERNLELLAESDEMIYDSAPREKAHLFFPRPIHCTSGNWYIAWAQINGPSSDCGAGGQTTIVAEDGVSFQFRNSRLSNNGTDSHVGQIPSLLYRTSGLSPSSLDGMTRSPCSTEALSRSIKLRSLLSVTPESMRIAFKLMSWILGQAFLEEAKTSQEADLAIWNQEKLVAIGVMTLRLISFYLRAQKLDKSEMLLTMDDMSLDLDTLADELVQLLNDDLFRRSASIQSGDVLMLLLEEAVVLHIDCFVYLFPNVTVIRDALTELMQHEYKSSWSLVALLSSLSHQTNPLALILDGGSESQEKNAAKDPKVSTFMTENFNNFLRFIVELVFAPSTPVAEGLGQSRLRDVAGDLLVTICEEIVVTSEKNCHIPIWKSPTRFKRISSHQVWENSIGAPDSISFKVDASGIELHGIGAYVGSGMAHNYNLEILISQGDGHQETWQVLEKSSGTFPNIDGAGQTIAMIRLPKPVKLQANSLYALRFYWQTGKTWCGEGGVSSVKLVNNARVAFQPCSLSLNGTNVSRGQIPILLYSASQSEGPLKIAPGMKEQQTKWFMQVIRMLAGHLMQSFTSGLIPCQLDFFSNIFGWITVFLHLHPKRSLEILNSLDEILPIVAACNSNRKICSGVCPKQQPQTVVESGHPYKAAQVTCFVAKFESEVHYMSLEFDHQSCTAQAEDKLCIYWSRGDDKFLPLASFSGNCNWPKGVIFSPGNTVWFILETTSGSDETAPEQLYGFKCVVSGCLTTDSDPLVRMEQELTWVCAATTRLLILNNSDKEGSLTFEEENEMIHRHGTLLRKGLFLAHSPNMHEAMNMNLPQRPPTAELKFASEFISASNHTVAGQLAAWFCPEPFIDLQSSELIVQGNVLQSGQPQRILVVPKDQYGRVATSDLLDVDVSVRFGNGDSDSSFPSLLNLQTEAYQPTYMNKARYISVSMMPRYHTFSFEELRLAYFRDAVLRESIQMLPGNDGSYVGSWVPRQGGTYLIECRLDGFQLSQSFRVDVGDSEFRIGQGNRRKIAQLSRARIAVCSNHISSQGIRIRSDPSLLSQTIGIITRGSAVSYIEELENGNGTWLRLTDESVILYCHSTHFPSQAWCLQYNKALQKVLLSREAEEDILTSDGYTFPSMLVASEETYCVATDQQIPIFANPGTDEKEIGNVPPGEFVVTNGWLQNPDGIWIRISAEFIQKYCGKCESDGFCLAQTSSGKIYLKRIQMQVSSNQYTLQEELNTENGNLVRPMSLPTGRKMGSKKGKPTAQVWPQPGRTGRPSQATQPSIADCSRSVFAAVLWHEQLLQDAMACAAYLRFHPELNSLQIRQHNFAELCSNVPRGLKLLVRLWQEVNSAVLTSIQQHLILPSPPMAIRSQPANAEQGRPIRDRGELSEQLCELCEGFFPPPISLHMRATHPGCGSHAGGQGYNSAGRYSSGWTGNCGDGGRRTATWYLLCQVCRRRYLQLTPGGQLMERSRRARQFRMAVGAVEPQKIMKQNAMFLLELNSCAEIDINDHSYAAVSQWTINLFPETKTCSNGSKICPPSSKATSHTSDPGPKRQLSVLHSSGPSSSEPTSRYAGATVDNASSVAKESGVFLASPSVALKALVPDPGDERSINTTLKKPVLAFVIQHHDLKRVRLSMRSSIQRATLFGHAFRVWNWLLHTVSTEPSVHDVLWNFLSAMASYAKSSPEANGPLNDRNTLLPHPWRLCLLSGSLGGSMLKQFHTFLQSIAMIIRSDSVDPSLRRLCFKAWMFQLTPHEQDLILSCHLLSSVGRVMSENENDSSWRDAGMSQVGIPDLEQLDDVTKAAHIETSSRSAMSVCLADGTTETFWESGEEDKNRAKILTLTVSSGSANGILLSIFIDNIRDDGYRTSQVSVSVANSGPNTFRKKLTTRFVDSQFKGWIKCCIVGYFRLHIELKGPDAFLRVRLVQVSGRWKVGLAPCGGLKPSPSHLLQFSAAQADAFSVFQTIASQAFSDEFSEDHTGTLRQQVLDILFSRMQPQPLQGYVCLQIVMALEREVDLLRDQSKRNYSYCSGLLGMLSRICSSKCGKEVFSSRNNLLPTLSELLLFATPIVQCLVIDTMEKLLAIFDPEGTDSKSLILNLLAVVAKVISLQVREKATRSVISATLHTVLSVEDSPNSWRIDRPCSPEIAKMVGGLIIDIAQNKYGESWALSVQSRIANQIMNLVGAPEVEQSLERCLHMQKFWLALAAVSVVRDKSWLETSPAWQNQGDKENPTMCENHDDGKTEAHLYCQVCRGSYCRACYTILHLNRRNRNHTIQMIPGNESRPEINVHEGCIRLRMTWLLCLLDSSTLNGMVEFSQNPPEDIIMYAGGDAAGSLTKLCRFCQNPTESELTEVCKHPECELLAPTACTKLLPCGHLCGGVAGEEICLPCLRCRQDPQLRQDSDDLCVICFTDRLGAAPAIHLKCSHVFHLHCCKATLSRKWAGPRITFGFMRCPLCQQRMEHPALEDILEPLDALFKEVSRKALMRLEYDGLTSCPAITSPSGNYHNDPSSYATDRYVYVLCHKCGRAYFGGEAQCQDALTNSAYNPEELLCGACSDVSQAQMCPRHGSEFLEYKCRYCCSVAVFFCFGTTHFCSQCHDDFQHLVSIPVSRLAQCPVGPRSLQLEGLQCPLKVEHPPTGEEFALGCGICRNLSTF